MHVHCILIFFKYSQNARYLDLVIIFVIKIEIKDRSAHYTYVKFRIVRTKLFLTDSAIISNCISSLLFFKLKVCGTIHSDIWRRKGTLSISSFNVLSVLWQLDNNIKKIQGIITHENSVAYILEYCGFIIIHWIPVFMDVVGTSEPPK